MPPAKQIAPLTDEEKFKAQLQAEQELHRLQRCYTSLEKDRYVSGAKVARLNHVLTLAKKDHQNIVTDLAVVNSPEKQKADVEAHHLASLLEYHDSYTNSVNEEKQYMVELDGQIKIVEKEVIKLRTQQSTDKQMEERILTAERTIEALEIKLKVQVKKFGGIYMELCGLREKISDMELCGLREKISGLLWERDNFMKNWNKLIGRLVLVKKIMLDLIEQTTIACDQREDWCNKLQLLRVTAGNDLLVHSKEMRELSRKLVDTKKLEVFYATRGQRRIMRDLEEKKAMKRKQYKEELDERLNKYQGLMDQILEFTQEPRIKIIAHKFYTQEAENLMRFNYINDLMEEMETITAKLGHLYVDIEENKALSNMRVINQNNTLKDLESQLEKAKEEYESSEEDIALNRVYLQKILAGIDTLFQICKCNRDPILDLLGDNRNVNQFNALLYIELIEKKVLHAMLEVYYRNKILFERRKISMNQRIIREERTKPVIYSVDIITRTTPCPLCLEHELMNDVVDSLQHVVTRQEAQKRIKTYQDTNSASRVHNVSDCHLPKSRSIIQRRYQ